MELLLQQYEMVKGSRQALFSYLATVAPEQYVQELPAFANGSLRNLQVHIANTYVHWLGKFGLEETLDYLDPTAFTTIGQVREAYQQVDELVSRFLFTFRSSLLTDVTRKLRSGQPLTTTPLMLFTHVFTHEFHHKGQLLTMSRQLGYVPVDTDVIRT